MFLGVQTLVSERPSEVGACSGIRRVLLVALLTTGIAAADDSSSSVTTARVEPSTLLEQHKLKQGAAEQGLALTKFGYFTSTSSTIYEYDTNWTLKNSRQIQIDGVNHMGAIHFHDGFLWVGLLHGPENGKYDKQLDRSIIAKIRADDLSVAQTWDITDDVTWIDPVCFDGESIWVGDLRKLGIHRYRLRDDKLIHDGVLRYPPQMHFSQGIRVIGRKLYTIHTFGEMDGLFEFDLPPSLTNSINQPTRVWAIQETRTHLEGFDFVPGTADQIWHAQGKWIDRYQLGGLVPITKNRQQE